MDIIMMGDSKAGRTSIAKVIFQKMAPNQTPILGETQRSENYEFKIHKIQFRVFDLPAHYDLRDPPPNELMLLKNASGLIFVLNPQLEFGAAVEEFDQIYQYLLKKNTNKCACFILINKCDQELVQLEQRNEYLTQLKHRLHDYSIDVKRINFHFTSIFDYTIFQAFSEIIITILPCSNSICKLLNSLASNCKLEKIYLFDLMTKLYIAQSDEKEIEFVKYEICSEMLDMFIDISFLYSGNSTREDNECDAYVRLSYDENENDELISLKSMEKYMALVFVAKETDYDRPYLVQKNIAVVQKSISRLMDATINSLK